MDMIKLKALLHKYDLDNDLDLINELGKEFKKVAQIKSKIKEINEKIKEIESICDSSPKAMIGEHKGVKT